LADAAAVSVAAEAMAARLKIQHPDAAIDGFLVQEMVEGLELILGVREDPQFGPFMLLGLGGVAVEVLYDVVIRLLPIDGDTAREMINSLRAAPLFGPFRGKPPRDVNAVIRAMTGLSRIFLNCRDRLTDIEINPLTALPDGQGVRAVDVRVIRREPGGQG
jgi:succinyl-CoA synthetase beta subunit